MTTTILQQRIQKRLDDLRISANKASVDAGLGRTYIQSILHGRSKSPGMENLRAIAKVLRCDPAYLTGDIDTLHLRGAGNGSANEPSLVRVKRAPVVGFVEAGSFRAVDEFADIELDDLPTVHIETNQRYPQARVFAVEVRGDSMLSAGIRPGDVVVALDWEDLERSPVNGDYLVVERIRDGGALREWTLKEVEVQKDKFILHPRSPNPIHRPIEIERSRRDDPKVKVRILGLVYQHIRRFDV